MAKYIRVTLSPADPVEDDEDVLAVLMPYVLFLYGETAVNIEYYEIDNE